MKKLIFIPCFAAATLLSLFACTTVHEKSEPATHSTTTTTEESTMHRPVGATSTTETHTVY